MDARRDVVTRGHGVDLVVAVVQPLLLAGLVGGVSHPRQLVHCHAGVPACGDVQLVEGGPLAGVDVEAVADQVEEVGRVFWGFVRGDGWAAVTVWVGPVEEDAGGAVERCHFVHDGPDGPDVCPPE